MATECEKCLRRCVPRAPGLLFRHRDSIPEPSKYVSAQRFEFRSRGKLFRRSNLNFGAEENFSSADI